MLLTLRKWNRHLVIVSFCCDIAKSQKHVGSKGVQYGIFICSMLGEQRRRSLSSARSKKILKSMMKLYKCAKETTETVWKINEEKETKWRSRVESIVLQNIESMFIKQKWKCLEQAPPEKPSTAEREINHAYCRTVRPFHPILWKGLKAYTVAKLSSCKEEHLNGRNHHETHGRSWNCSKHR